MAPAKHCRSWQRQASPPSRTACCRRGAQWRLSCCRAAQQQAGSARSAKCACNLPAGSVALYSCSTKPTDARQLAKQAPGAACSQGGAVAALLASSPTCSEPLGVNARRSCCTIVQGSTPRLVVSWLQRAPSAEGPIGRSLYLQGLDTLQPTPSTRVQGGWARHGSCSFTHSGPGATFGQARTPVTCSEGRNDAR